MSGVPYGVDLALVHLGAFLHTDRKAYSLCYDSTLRAVVPSPCVRGAVAESLNRDLGKVSELCDLCRMKVNVSKIKTIIVSRLRRMHPLSSHLHFRNCAEESNDYKIYCESNLILNGFREAFSLCFQSSFSKAWNHEDVLSSI